MRWYLALGVLSVAGLVLAGCISKDKYLAATAEIDAVKADLDKARAQKSALEQQIKGIKDANTKLTADNEFMSAELQRMKESRDKERSSIDARTKDLEQRTKDLAAQHRVLKQEYEDVKKHNETLKATVARYQKELKERERSIALPTPPILPKPPALPPGGSPSQAAPDSAGSVPPSGNSGAATQSPSAPVNINTATASELVLYLGLTKDMAERVISNRPYKIKGELVAKNVMPKQTFDLLKDRMTVAQ